MVNRFYQFIIISLLFIINASSLAQPKQSWADFIRDVRAQALSEGIRPEVVDQAFKGVRAPNRRVLNLDRSQPEKRLTYLKYRNTRADAFRIKLGRSELKKHQALLNQVYEKFGVSPCFITSIWGLETSYGRFMGSFPVIKSLSTLAYDNRRSAFFRKQLLLALHILNDGHVSLDKFKGEWAGASGHPQFLPSSWHNYAVDYNQDGRKDIWTNLGDVFASISNYLKQNGWKNNEPWAVPVTVPRNFDKQLITTKVAQPINKTVAQWQALGVKPMGDQRPLPSQLQAAIIDPHGGPKLMIFNNFKVIMKWNRSIYYAGTVGYMAEKICRRPL